MKKAGLIGPVRKVDLAGMAITVEGRHQPRSTKFSWDQRFYKTASEYTSEEDCRNALALLHERIRANGLLAKFPELDNMSCIKDGPTGAELLQEDTYEEQFKDTPLSLPKLPRSMDSEEENDRFLAARERKFRSLPSPMRSSPSGRSTKRRKHQAHHASDEDYEGDDFDDYEDSDRHHQRPTNSPSKQGRKRQKAGSSPRSSKNHRQGS